MEQPPQSDSTREKWLDELENHPSPTRGKRRLIDALLLASAVVVPVVVWWDAGGARIQARPLWYVIGMTLGWVMVAAWAVWGSLARGPSMLGPGRRWVKSIVMLTPALLFVWTLAWDFIDADRLAPWEGRWGEKCLKLTLLLGAWPLLALLLLRRGSDPVHPGLRGAAIGAAVGCCTGVLVDLWCPITDPKHMLLGHILPLILLSAGGLLLGKWLLDVRRRHLAKREAVK